MSEWSGFTDADLKKMRQLSENDATNHNSGPKIVKPVVRGRPKAGNNVGQRAQRKPNSRVVRGTNSKAKGEIPPGAALSISATSPTMEEKNIISPPTTQNEQIPLHGKSSTPPPVGMSLIGLYIFCPMSTGRL